MRDFFIVWEWFFSWDAQRELRKLNWYKDYYENLQ
jgi:hypothetical protein